MHSSGNQARDMRHINQEKCTNTVGNFPHSGKVDLSWVRRPSGNQHRWLLLSGLFSQFVVVDQAGFFLNQVMMSIKPATRQIGLGAVTKMSTRGQIQTKNPVSGFEGCEKYRLVGLGAGMG